jgi:predicted kinase
VVLMRGVPGSGKSSFVDRLCRTHSSYDRPDTVVASADDYFVDVLGNYNFDARQLSAAHGYAQATFRKALGDRRVIVDNTNVRLGDLQQYLSLIATYAKHSALASPVVVAVVTVLPPKGMPLDVYADGCAARNAHGVPRHVISRMIEELASQYPDAESGDPDLTTFNRMAAVLSGPDKAEKA